MPLCPLDTADKGRSLNKKVFKAFTVTAKSVTACDVESVKSGMFRANVDTVRHRANQCHMRNDASAYCEHKSQRRW